MKKTNEENLVFKPGELIVFPRQRVIPKTFPYGIYYQFMKRFMKKD